MPPCHRHMVIASTLSVHCFNMLHCSTNKTSAKCCLGFTTQDGYQMFLGLSGSALRPPNSANSGHVCVWGGGGSLVLSNQTTPDAPTTHCGPQPHSEHSSTKEGKQRRLAWVKCQVQSLTTGPGHGTMCAMH